MIQVDLVAPTPTKPEQSVAVLRDQIMPMYGKLWQNVSPEYYANIPFDPHIQLLLDMWFTGGMRLILAKNELGEAVGFATCIVFRPLQYAANVLQVSDFYDSGIFEVRTELTKYIENMCRMLNCNEIWYDTHSGSLINFSSTWQPQRPMVINRYVKQE